MRDVTAVTFITPDLANNSLGRTYSLWLLARHLGWHTRVYSTVGESLWLPVRETEFAMDTRRASVAEIARDPFVSRSDIIVAVKPLYSSFGVARVVAGRIGRPLLLDIDDPDIDAHLNFQRPLRAIAREVRHPVRQRRIRALARLLPIPSTIVSNPALQDRYGGAVVPHARAEIPAGAPHVSSSPRVAFVGTNRVHKGVPVLRRAIEQLSHLGFELVVTDVAPRDARPWEQWLGQTDFRTGLELVRNADVVAIPSLDGPYSRGQLPAKLIDAMLAARAIVASDFPPVAWAIGEAGVLVEPGSDEALVRALLHFRAPVTRASSGRLAREAALRRFTVPVLAADFERACRGAIENHFCAVSRDQGGSSV